MLKLTRRPGESLILLLPDGRQIEVVVDNKRGNQAGLAIDAPQDIKILRTELINDTR